MKTEVVPQELRIAAAVSKDSAMTRAFTDDESKTVDKDIIYTDKVEVKDPDTGLIRLEDKLITVPQGTVYVNPYADLHCLSAVTCINPPRYKNLPECMWRIEADKVDRKPAKVMNFAAIYLAAANSVAELNHVRLEVAERWLKGHADTFAGFYSWAHYYGGIAEARGYAISPLTDRMRWVDESNSKGSGESPMRSAVNHAIKRGWH